MLELTAGNYITIAIVIINLGVSLLMRINDFKHVAENQKTMIAELKDFAQRLSRLEGICSITAKREYRKKR
jgi:hypothetical protein